jgi:hypothetical protein
VEETNFITDSNVEEEEHFGEQWTVMDITTVATIPREPAWGSFPATSNQRGPEGVELYSTVFYDGSNDGAEVWGDYSQPEIITAVPDWRLNDIEEDANEDNRVDETVTSPVQQVDEDTSTGFQPHPIDNRMLNRYRRKNDDLPYQSTDSENSNNVPEIEITTELHLAEEGIATENIGGQGKVEAWDYDASDEITLEPDYFEESLRILPNHLEKTNSLELEDGPARGPKYIRQVQSHGVEGIKVESAQDQVDATGKQNEITPASGQPGNLGLNNR